MRYEGTVYRPPSEAMSLIIQATVGCSHNQCTFCSMYKEKRFRIRPLEEIFEDLEAGRNRCGKIKRIFLADGNALALSTESLKKILAKIQELFPECERVGIYSAPKDILKKSSDELKELHALGLGIAYMGIESGSDAILKAVKKGVTSQEMIEAGQKMTASGIKLSVTLISGLGGKENWQEHAIESAKVINAIGPHYLGLLTLLIQQDTEMAEQIRQGLIKLLSPEEVLRETALLIENIHTENCIFRSNHASNYFALEGVLSEDRAVLLKQIESALEGGCGGYRGEYYRRL